MFVRLFVRSDALSRQLSAPLVDERRRYLTHRAEQGMSKGTLRAKARFLLSITTYLKLADRPNDTISIQAIQRAATQRSYRDTLSLLLPFAAQVVRKEVDQISVINPSSDIVRLFLRHLEESRKCGVAPRSTITYLEKPEMDALLKAPDQSPISCWPNRRVTIPWFKFAAKATSSGAAHCGLRPLSNSRS